MFQNAISDDPFMLQIILDCFKTKKGVKNLFLSFFLCQTLAPIGIKL